MKEHLVVIVDNNKQIEPRLYSCKVDEKTKDQAVQAAKSDYERKYQNKNYESYHFIH